MLSVIVLVVDLWDLNCLKCIFIEELSEVNSRKIGCLWDLISYELIFIG